MLWRMKVYLLQYIYIYNIYDVDGNTNGISLSNNEVHWTDMKFENFQISSSNEMKDKEREEEKDGWESDEWKRWTKLLQKWKLTWRDDLNFNSYFIIFSYYFLAYILCLY